MTNNKIRFVTAASLFDGHDAAINIMRRILQSSGAEVIHLGHNRSVRDIADTAIQENVQGIAISSYQGGHIEYFKYLYDLLQERGAGHIKIFGGGGGVIVPEEIRELQDYGIERIYSPEDGLEMGLQGMIDDMLRVCDFPSPCTTDIEGIKPNEHLKIGRAISAIESGVLKLVGVSSDGEMIEEDTLPSTPVLGLTGTGGAGKSTLTDELIRRFLSDFEDLSIAVLSVDPTRKATGGALLGDRIRMNSIYGDYADRVYMRSLATRQPNKATSAALDDSIELCKKAGFDLIIIETAGIGQSDTEIEELADIALYVMTHEFGAPTQLEKIGMLDSADFVVLNKFEKKGSLDGLRDIRKQVQRNRMLFDRDPKDMPVYPTMASRYNDPGVSKLYLALLEKLNEDWSFDRSSQLYSSIDLGDIDPSALSLIPSNRYRYLGEIAENIRAYHQTTQTEAELARKWGHLHAAGEIEEDPRLLEKAQEFWNTLHPESRRMLEGWSALEKSYKKDELVYQVRGRDIKAPMYRESLSGLKIPRVALPKLYDAGDRMRFLREEGLPGFFPFSAGVFPLKRAGEDPTRMFAGEGSPERTNKRFHLVSEGLPAKRLSTAFDSVTLYGFNPDEQPDIYGKVGNSGVSICTLDDMKKLYSGFNLVDKSTSVSMTINGPAAIILALYMNTAIDQQIESILKSDGRWEQAQIAVNSSLGDSIPQYIPYHGSTGDGAATALPEGHDGSGLGLLGSSGKSLVELGILDEEEFASIKDGTLRAVRGTVQADILKEDQAQNTCIFSTDFSMKIMGDVQEYFVQNGVRNYYSVSISGYHIAEAGANPISQLAFTLSNGFTLVEYYLARGMSIDDFAPNLSFFFSNGLDPEYSVIGRVARRIWAIAIRDLYEGNERSQKLKYHIQTSGRSLHAQEIQFNDIRTTLQALSAIYDNCNSLHTNAYDEAITTPTEESVRRAMAIQMIINKELGLAMNENSLQGSYIIEELTDLVEEAVLIEFERINDRGGVLGAMETMYQRGKIQEESMYYEHKKHSGDLPIVGVNTFVNELDKKSSETRVELMRSTDSEKQAQLSSLQVYENRHPARRDEALDRLKKIALEDGNIFEELMETVRFCSLGQITRALFEVGGQYRRNM